MIYSVRQVSFLAVICSVMPAVWARDPGIQGSSSPPNVVLILSDDQAWTDYGFMGHAVIQTPNLDALASRSAVFRRGYTPVPLCRPSLLSIITGLYPHQHAVSGNDPRPDSSLSEADYASRRESLISRVDQLQTLPRRLAEHGFVSMQSGKWWEGNYRRGGFTHGMTRGFPEKGGRHGDDGLAIGRPTMEPVLKFMTEAKAEGKPFFLWYAPMLPHTPHNPPERLLAKYRRDDRPIELSRYFAMCEWFDESCGTLLNHLRDLELQEKTLVVYVTDNGWIQATPDMKLPEPWKNGFAPRSKQSPYEGGIRTPIMYSWPGHIQPGDRAELATTLDVFPTVLSAAALSEDEEPGQRLPGLNLLPALKSGDAIDRTRLNGESFSHDVADIERPEASLQYRWAIRDQWKLILSYEAPKDRYAWVHEPLDRSPQLFNLIADPSEQHNLAAEHPDIVDELEQQLQETWAISQNAIGRSPVESK